MNKKKLKEIQDELVELAYKKKEQQTLVSAKTIILILEAILED